MVPPKVALVEIGCGRPELNEPLGICTIAACTAKDTALTPTQIDLYWNKLVPFIFEPERSCEYALLGVSAQINSLPRLESFFAGVRSRNTTIPIVIGNLLGIYASESLLELFPDAIVCEGEGEQVFSDLVNAVYSGPSASWRSALHFISGIAFRDRGQIVRTPVRLKSLDSVPPPRRDFASSLRSVGGINRIETSRGCHWGRCEFCSVESRFGLGGYRRFPTSRILDDLVQLSEQGVLSPYFSDEDFFGRRYAESIDLANAVKRSKIMGRLPRQLNFFCSVLASDVTNRDGQHALAAWREAGLREVFVGVETGATPEIKRFAKKANVQTNTSAISILRTMGFQVDIGFIMFDPKMSLADLDTNVKWLKSQDLSGIDSRVTKRLRIQPRTKMMTTYSDVVTGQMLVDELSYPIRFVDERVEWIANEFGKWENTTKELVYELLAKARGEVPSEAFRMKLKTLLAELRDCDLSYLERLIEASQGTVAIDIAGLGETLADDKRLIIESALAMSA